MSFVSGERHSRLKYFGDVSITDHQKAFELEALRSY
jgi:hypothetical protein